MESNIENCNITIIPGILIEHNNGTVSVLNLCVGFTYIITSYTIYILPFLSHGLSSSILFLMQVSTWGSFLLHT